MTTRKKVKFDNDENIVQAVSLEATKWQMLRQFVSPKKSIQQKNIREPGGCSKTVFYTRENNLNNS